MKLSLTQMPELKEAILSLPDKEKDKLLIRLINKDQMLIKQLHYKLLESEGDLLARTHELDVRITESFNYLNKLVAKATDTKKFDIVNIHIRQLSGFVNEHASITKDKVSELQLRLLILNQCFLNYPNLYQTTYPSKSLIKHFEYIATRFIAILAIYDKLHPDLQYDYRKDLLEVLDFIAQSAILPFVEVKKINLSKYYE